ncbi:hypothetical protein AHAS_Ahas05G0257700 [Arachis hypogaea]
MPLPKTLLSLLLLSVTIAAVTADYSAVMSKLLKSLTSPPTDWSPNTPYCQRTSITCNSSNHVTKITLSSKSLTETLPSDLQENSLSGPLPSLSDLSNLQTAYFDRNNFTSVPSAVFSGLTSLQKLSL